MSASHPLEQIPIEELQKQGLAHRINLWEQEHDPAKRTISIQGEISTIKQSLFDMEHCRGTWRERLGMQQWGTIQHAQEEMVKGEQVIASLSLDIGRAHLDALRSCQQGSKDPCWTLGAGIPLFRLSRCECGDLVALFHPEGEGHAEIRILLDALSRHFLLDIDPVICPSGRRHIHLGKK